MPLRGEQMNRLLKDLRPIYQTLVSSGQREYVDQKRGRIVRLVQLPDGRAELESLIMRGIDRVQVGESLYLLSGIVWVGYLDRDSCDRASDFLFFEEFEG